MCIFCLLVVAPIMINLLGKAVDYKNSKEVVKSEEAVGHVLEYTLITDSKGETINFNTTIEYELDGYTYSKVFVTRYYIADKGEYVKMYYEKGNPYSADVVKKDNKFSLQQKMNVYSLICMLMILFFSVNTYNDMMKARERRMMLAQGQYNIQLMNNGINPNLSNMNNTPPKW